MIHKKIEQLIPFVDENFITFPLWEEGDYAPHVNIWLIFDSDNEADSIVKKVLGGSVYDYYIENDGYSNIRRISIFPAQYFDCHGNFHVHQDSSIEEMIDLAKKIIDGYTRNRKQRRQSTNKRG